MNQEIPRLDRQELPEVLMTNEGLFVVGCVMPEIPSCQLLSQELAQVAPEFEGVINFAEFLVDPTSLLENQFALTSLPTLLLFRDAEEIERIEQCWGTEAWTEYFYLAASYYHS